MVGVDIFIPSYNHGRFLKERIESILNQSFGNFNVHIFDDASTDESADIFKEFSGDPRLKNVYINQQTSGSPFGNWSRFIPLIKEDFVWVAESDDYVNLDFLSLAIEEHNRYKNLGMVVGKSTVVDESGGPMGEARDYFVSQIPPLVDNDYSQVFDGKSVIKYELINRNPFPNMSAVLFSSKILHKCLATELPRFYFLRDWLLYQQVLSISDVAVMKKRVNFFRSHRASTRVGEKPLIDWVRLMHERFFVCEDACQRSGLSKPLSDQLLENIFNRMSTRMKVSDKIKYITSKLNLNDSPTYIYGAGSLGDEVYRKLYDADLGKRIVGFIDKSVGSLKNIRFNNVPVFGPERIDCLDAHTNIIIASIEFRHDMLDRLKRAAFPGQILTLDCE
jgi:glycosyltransferase involved in cell wall biosynthesis